ncbi:MAG: V-type ATP synthase subunit F [Candidatus Hydrothermarchaeota archaeon]
MKISVLGDATTVTGFRLAGIRDAYEVSAPKEAVGLLRELVGDKEMGLVIVTERIADEIRAEMEGITEGRITPLIVEIPDREGPMAKKVDPIKELIKRAVGVEIKFG